MLRRDVVSKVPSWARSAAASGRPSLRLLQGARAPATGVHEAQTITSIDFLLILKLGHPGETPFFLDQIFNLYPLLAIFSAN